MSAAAIPHPTPDRMLVIGCPAAAICWQELIKLSTRLETAEVRCVSPAFGCARQFAPLREHPVTARAFLLQ